MASVGPAPPLSPPTLRSVAAPTHLTPPSPLQLPSSYRTPSPIQIELELEDEVHVTARAGFESSPKGVGNRPLAAAGVDIGSMFDLAQRIELTGVIDMPVEKVPIVAAGGGAGSPLREKKACTKVRLELAFTSRRLMKLNRSAIVHGRRVQTAKRRGVSQRRSRLVEGIGGRSGETVRRWKRRKTAVACSYSFSCVVNLRAFLPTAACWVPVRENAADERVVGVAVAAHPEAARPERQEHRRVENHSACLRLE